MWMPQNLFCGDRGDPGLAVVWGGVRWEKALGTGEAQLDCNHTVRGWGGLGRMFLEEEVAVQRGFYPEGNEAN